MTKKKIGVLVSAKDWEQLQEEIRALYKAIKLYEEGYDVLIDDLREAQIKINKQEKLIKELRRKRR